MKLTFQCFVVTYEKQGIQSITESALTGHIIGNQLNFVKRLPVATGRYGLLTEHDYKFRTAN